MKVGALPFYDDMKFLEQLHTNKAVERSENPGLPVLFGGHNLPPLVEIGLTDPWHPRPAPPGTPGLVHLYLAVINEDFILLSNLSRYITY